VVNLAPRWSTCGRLNRGPLHLRVFELCMAGPTHADSKPVTTLGAIAVSPDLCVAAAEYNLAAVKNC